VKPAEVYIINQSEPYRTILIELKSFIEVALPEVELLFKYKCPFFYYKNKPFCYLNVSLSKRYVDVGFIKGYKLTHNYLVSDNRSIVKSLRYFSENEIDFNVLKEVLVEAKENAN